MAVSDGAILRIVASLLFPESVIAQNIFYTVFTDTGTSDDEDDVISDLVTWIESMYTQLNSWMNDEIAGSQIQVYYYDSVDDDWDEVGSEPITVAPTSNNDMLPHGCAGIMHAKTSNPDVQATKYFGGLTEGSCTGSSLGALLTAKMVDLGDAWVAPFVGGITGADFGPGVWSTAKTNFFLFNGVFVINGDIGYQRRRKPGVGI